MRKHHIEPLEERRMFITYQVDGTSGNDTISISISGNSIISVVNGNSDSASDIINNNIEVNGLGGNDTISIIETGNNTVVVNAGTGNDTINAGNGGNDLDVIDDNMTINGDGNTDTLVLFDQNQSAFAGYLIQSGNLYSRSGVPNIAGNVESVVIHAPTNQQSNLLFLDPTTADVTFNGSTSQLNFVVADGLGSRDINYTPSSTTTGSGLLAFGGSNVTFTKLDGATVNDMDMVTVITPNAADVLALSGTSSTAINGTSGGVAITSLTVASAGTLFIDAGLNEAGAIADSITGTTGHISVNSLLLKVGQGVNTLNANGGSWNLSTIDGNNLTVKVNNATLAFNGSQNVNRLELSNSGVASLTGNPTVLNLQSLAVTAGTGTISPGSNNSINVNTGCSFFAGTTLNKSGGGTLNISAAQSHGTNALFTSKGGTTNFSTDCGSTSSRPLNVFADSGIINLNATQHVNSVETNFGNINVGSNGNRVVVTNGAFIGGEGGSINLNNNDMVVDYTGATQMGAIRTLLRNGYANGNWNGIGINSATANASPQQNTALGSMEASEFKSIYGAGATFSGQTIDTTAILIKFTYYGDADLNGVVDFDDYVRADGGFNSGLSGWSNGDFDYNNDIDFDDYVLIDNAFNTQTVVL